jgi:hypothetical protein
MALRACKVYRYRLGNVRPQGQCGLLLPTRTSIAPRTGRQLFEKDRSLISSDAKFQEEGTLDYLHPISFHYMMTSMLGMVHNLIEALFLKEIGFPYRKKFRRSDWRRVP